MLGMDEMGRAWGRINLNAGMRYVPDTTLWIIALNTKRGLSS